ncbi:MAG: hypothetical protein R3B93_22895 [Bacteroidia bacterium]
MDVRPELGSGYKGAAGIPPSLQLPDVINDEIAQRFAIRFYKGLGGYASLQKLLQMQAAEIMPPPANNFRSLYFC